MKKRQFIAYTLCYALIIFVSGCNILPQQKNTALENQAETDQDSQLAEAEQSHDISSKSQDQTQNAQQLVINNGQSYQKRQQILEVGTGEYIAAPSPKNKASSESSEGDITLNFQGTDMNEFAKVILSDILGENFLIDPGVSGTVTIETSKPLAKKDIFPLLEEILAINNAVIFKSGGLYQIMPKAKAIRGNLSPEVANQSQGFDADGYSVKMVPLQFIAAQEMQKILEPFISEGGNIRVDKQRNMLVLAGTSQELQTLQETIDIFDVDWLRGMSVGLYPLEYIDPKTLKAELDAILGGVGDGAGQGNELLGGLVRTLAIERLNSLLLISSTTAALREAEIWLHRLDRPGEQVGQHLYVYEVQNSKATELADILGHIFDGNSSSSSSSAPALAPGTTPVEISSTDAGQNEATTQTTAPVSAGSSGLSLVASDSIEIIADDTRNALVIMASARDYKMVAAAIRKLDVVPLQVLIEASILEVTLNDDLSYGVEWFFKNGFDGARAGSEGQGQLDLGDAGIAALAPSFSYTIINNAANVRVALNALESESEINVLSSPSLMVLDNQTATINVGDEIPVPTRQSVSNIDPNAPSVNEIQFRNTGVTLTVTPRVNNSGLVTMDIKQEVSNAVATTSSDIDAPTIQQRQIESTVAINSGETIVLGGLIQESETSNESGVPGLYKIPVIGKLFGQTSDESRRTELIVLLTPRVVRNNHDARQITDEFRRKLKSLPSKNIDVKEIMNDKAS